MNMWHMIEEDKAGGGGGVLSTGWVRKASLRRGWAVKA